ncbi:MAG: AMP-binding protein [Myxococcota bacterium]|nr:AMP-binding protein [Myxococcota bacterium]
MRPALSLYSLVVDSRRSDDVVAFERSVEGGETMTSRAQWSASVAELTRRLASAGVGRGSRVALYDEDPLRFSIGLFALWQRAAVAVLAPNSQPGTCERLRQSVDAAIGSDIGLDSGETHAVDLSAFRDASDIGDDDEFGVLAPDTLALELFTSGTTGEGKAAAKQLRHLADEVCVLEATFGEGLADARVFATASHQHLYGLLFHILWPLVTARPFCRDRLLHAEELLPRIATEASSVLASVPAHLDRMRAAAGFAQLASMTQDQCRVFSSGGPLASETAHGWESMLGDAPIEVFGSTETGGVAYRSQPRALGEDVAWTPFEGVSVVCDEVGCLRVESLIVSEGQENGALRSFSMGDRAEFDSDGRFRLRGRADRVVKIGEKRVSLPDMELLLRGHDAVTDAALVAVARGGQQRVGAVVVPSSAGAAALEASGRAALARELAEHLRRDFDRVLVPRAWRYVDALPEDAQGKTTASSLLALFNGDASNARERRREPECLEARAGCDSDIEWLERSLFISPDLEAFEGHFPGSPIVPGVAQLDWAISAATELLGFGAHPERIEALKFTSPLEPDTHVVLRVTRRRGAAHDEQPVRVSFEILRAATPADAPQDSVGSGISQGRLYLVPDTPSEAPSHGPGA